MGCGAEFQPGILAGCSAMARWMERTVWCAHPRCCHPWWASLSAVSQLVAISKRLFWLQARSTPGASAAGGASVTAMRDARLSPSKCSVAAGERRSCAVTAAGKLFTWGYGGAGQLEHSDTADQLAPRHVEALQGEFVVVVSAGGNHNIAATRECLAGGERARWACKAKLTSGYVCILSPCRYPQLSCVPNP